MDKRTIKVPGIPVPQGSKRHVGGGRMIEANKDLKPYRVSIISAVRDAHWHLDPMLAGPIRVHINFYLPRPKNHYGTGRNEGKLKVNAPMFHDKSKDIDKMSRAVLDALTQAGVWKDDGQVAALSAHKFWGDPPMTDITITRLIN